QKRPLKSPCRQGFWRGGFLIRMSASVGGDKTREKQWYAVVPMQGYS
ncbi:hypothetical protein HMPREF1556_00532, partial [Porphyromonas sp. oral taxon 278 str. W7784]